MGSGLLKLLSMCDVSLMSSGALLDVEHGPQASD